MKKKTINLLLCACGVLGVLFCVDLALFTDQNTGFVTRGSVWLRYGLLFGLIILMHTCAVVAGMRDRKKRVPPRPFAPAKPLCYALSAAGALGCYAGVQYAVEEFVLPTTQFGLPESGIMLQLLAFWMRIGIALAMGVLCVWSFFLAVHPTTLRPEKSMLRRLGVLCGFGFLFLPVLRYAESPVTTNRVILVLPVFSALAGAWFFVQLIGLLSRPYSQMNRAGFVAAGLTAFIMCTCVGVVHAVWLYLHGMGGLMMLSSSLVLAVLGVIGGYMALQAAD